MRVIEVIRSLTSWAWGPIITGYQNRLATAGMTMTALRQEALAATRTLKEEREDAVVILSQYLDQIEALQMDSMRKDQHIENLQCIINALKPTLIEQQLELPFAA